MSAYEKEVTTLIKFKGERYADRQDYLAALIRATDKWLSDHDKNGDIFDGWDNALCSWLDEGIKAMNAKQTILDFPDVELGQENMVPVLEDDNEDLESETPEGEHTGVVEVPGGEIIEGDDLGREKENTAERSQTPKKKRSKTRYEGLSGARDKYGIVIGTKTHAAVLLYEQGTTSKEIMEEVGGRHYNILTKLKRDGHQVEALPGGGFKLTHKDDLKAS